MNWPQSEQLLADNARLIPGGLASLNRKADPVIAFVRAKGSRLWDIDGHEYIDYHAGFAPYILGHGDEDQTAAVIDAMQSGLSNYGSGPTLEEGVLARLFLKAVPHAEKVQFFNTGSEATSQAIRVARAWTGRSHLIKMQGGYNGHHNAVATNLMSTREQLGGVAIHGDEYPSVPISAGIPPVEQALTHAVPFNDLAAVEQIAKRGEIAALITEPVLQNIGVVKPKPGYLQGLRDLADRYGFVLIFDEVKTGFRSSLGGYQAVAGVSADLSTYGKAVANGFPLAALAGKAELLDLAMSPDPTKRVLIAGTYNCHPVPVAAAIACLKKLMDPAHRVYDKLEALAQRLEAGQRALFDRFGVPTVISRVGSASCVYFSTVEPSDWWDVLEHHDAAFDTRYRRALIERGIYHFPVIVKQGSISFAHSEADIDQTLEATESALRALTAGPKTTT
ncbi:glutamate-1-semialdehyde 2,1-aminomutase [Singulisphaera sp. GP187]|uniref:aspartate aminotransferase family protein n=1 Tax=Singulisphaera sp. GP187 TaxID=1882752 RepID=UPI00092C4922|nr:aspartate aminotransferase family protein [Singulisphaera sp. GP187]SIO41591.1 glutamate-1-semialdehyde 2,1-aminomutase [Singulisphaera sp. GP187]